MGIPSGLGASVGYASETVYGQPVTVTRFHPLVEESIANENERLESDGIIAGARVLRSEQWKPGNITVGGDLGFELFEQGMGVLFEHMLGSVTSSTTGGVATHTFTPGDLTSKSLTIQVGRPTVTGTVIPFTYCVDEQTEVLTQRGWVGHRALDTDDQVLALDPETRRITWQQVQAVHRFDWDGTLTRWRSQRIDALTTPNHRWLVETDRGREPLEELRACPECGTTSGKNGPFASSHAVRCHLGTAHGIKAHPAHRATEFRGQPAFRVTEELASLWDSIIVGGGTPACFASAPVYADEFVELVGWVVTEGYYQSGKDAGQGVIVAQSETVNPAYVTRIRRIAEHFRADGATVSEYEGANATHWYFGKGIGKAVREAAPMRQLTPEFLCALTRDQAQVLYDTLIDGDGHRRAPRNSRGIRRDGGSDAETWAQKDQGRVDGFQMLAAMLGKRTWAHAHSSGTSTVAVHQDEHVVGRTMPAEPEDYLGTVWCPQTSTGTWFARRNGCTYWTGNSGCKLSEFELAVEAGEKVTLGLTVLGQSETTGIALASATYLTRAAAPFIYREGGISVSGASVKVRSLTLAGNNSLADDRRNVGSGEIDEPLEMELREYTGALTLEFSSTSQYDRYIAGLEVPLVLSLSAGTNAQATITMNVRFDGETPAVSGKELVVHDIAYKAIGTTNDAAAITAVLINSQTSL